ncbi:MAG: GtrA family protein [Candidatus Coproplasma sp.]
MEERDREITHNTVDNVQGNDNKDKKSKGLKQFIQLLKFTAFSISAGVIQFVTTSALYDWSHLLPYWTAYVIGLTLSVIWNFTFNRKFTFASATNIPLSMMLVVIYNCLIVVPLAWGGQLLADYWGNPYGMLVTVIAMLINFVTEFFWDKFVVFNERVIGKIETFLKRKKGDKATAVIIKGEEVTKEEEVPTEETVATDTLLLK